MSSIGSDYSNWSDIVNNSVDSAEKAKEKSQESKSAAKTVDSIFANSLFRKNNFAYDSNYSIVNTANNVELDENGDPLSFEARNEGFSAMSLEDQASYLDAMDIAIEDGWVAVDAEGDSDYFMKVDEAGNTEYLKVVNDAEGNEKIVHTTESIDGSYKSNVYDISDSENISNDENNGDVVKTENNHEYTYDENGTLTSSKWYDDNGNTLETQENEYDENGNKISTIFYGSDGNMIETLKNEFNEYGIQTGGTFFDSDENVIGEIYYDADGIHMWHSSNSAMSPSTQYCFNFFNSINSLQNSISNLNI